MFTIAVITEPAGPKDAIPVETLLYHPRTIQAVVVAVTRLLVITRVAAASTNDDVEELAADAAADDLEATNIDSCA
jgi:hypothetical protein